MRKYKLPNTMSGLILVALKDLEKVEKLKDYTIDMAHWHTAPNKSNGMFDNPSGKCAVCFAGCVMSRTLKVPKNQTKVDFPLYIKYKLFALNALREGQVYDAANYLGLEVPDKILGRFYNTEIVEYEDNKRLFKRQMNKLAKNLKAAGL